MFQLCVVSSFAGCRSLLRDCLSVCIADTISYRICWYTLIFIFTMFSMTTCPTGLMVCLSVGLHCRHYFKSDMLLFSHSHIPDVRTYNLSEWSQVHTLLAKENAPWRLWSNVQTLLQDRHAPDLTGLTCDTAAPETCSRLVFCDGGHASPRHPPARDAKTPRATPRRGPPGCRPLQ